MAGGAIRRPGTFLRKFAPGFFVELYRRVFAHVPPVEEIELINLPALPQYEDVDGKARCGLTGARREAWKIGVASPRLCGNAGPPATGGERLKVAGARCAANRPGT